ncbi:MAG: pyridoxal 5'-phosphate synthase glutaminase subunit PdxT [bacterium]|nr:pyridoxal 5'-phosphate synthase glutaminase subunit PdxT [bacterium]
MTNYQSPITVGVLALQGDFAEHKAMLTALNVRSIEVRSAKDLESCDALVLPGGESTVMMKLLKESGLDQEIMNRVQSGMPIFGTCAGAILLSDSHLKLIDITVERNAYGSQLQSFSAQIDVEGIGSMEAVCIRAPIITRVGDGVGVLAQHEDHPVLVQKGNILAATFHPELCVSHSVHKMFIENVRALMQ